MRRLIALGLLGLLVASCGTSGQQHSQVAPPTPTQALLPTPTLAAPLPTSFELVEAEELFIELGPPLLQPKRVDADPRWRELPNDVLLIVRQGLGDDPADGLNYRDLGLFDTQGQLLFSPNHELEKLGWCSPEHSVYAPHAQWSDDGHWFLLGCQAEEEQFRYAILDLARNQWLLINMISPMSKAPSLGIMLEHNQFWLTYYDSEPQQIRVYQFDPTTDEDTNIALFTAYKFAEGNPSPLLHLASQPDGRIMFHAWRASAGGLYLWQAGQLYSLQFDQPLALDERFIWAANHESVVVYHTATISPTLQQTYELELDLTTQQISLVNTTTTWLAPPSTVARHDYNWTLRLDGWHFEHNQQQVAFLPKNEQLFTAFGDWRKNDGQAWMCQVEQGVGARVLAFDASGQSTEVLQYPNVGFSYPYCVSEAPSGLLAISLSNNRIVLVDAQGQELATIVGASRGWRSVAE